ncbi:hypothetical protein SS50377_27119 [Spironucleus salmonicida]|uniref:Uncharacterized protein n=1 Tax=Spironucleus salmonicida TaxID=348837 RepID=V6LHI4_9EUKA|nr:hypothetical protein SS50377_27119 [Spironucleus salmonicida]|eukprot:EST43753.1 Hypothetical protein SS50377_16488 [Spironucleus salmonicida]
MQFNLAYKYKGLGENHSDNLMNRIQKELQKIPNINVEKDMSILGSLKPQQQQTGLKRNISSGVALCGDGIILTGPKGLDFALTLDEDCTRTVSDNETPQI